MTDYGNYGMYVCPVCGQKRVVARLLEEHMRREHPGVEDW